MRHSRIRNPRLWLAGIVGAGLALVLAGQSLTQPNNDAPPPKREVGKTSYDQISPVLIGKQTFADMMAKDKAGKAEVMARQKALLEERYDLARKVSKRTKMTRGKPVPVGPTARLPAGVTWQELAKMSPEDIRDKGLFPKGYLPLPHPNHPVGGMVFPQHQIKQFKRLERFDLDFDLPEHFLPEFPPAMFLTTRPDLGDVSQGKVVTIENFQDLFQGILNAKDLEGMRLLVTQFPQQQFNATHDRKTEIASQGVACFDCHVNGHTSSATHLVGDIRPQSHRRRIDTVSLRGVNVQRIFGSQRAMKSVEDFTEFEQLAAYFDGDPLTAIAKGINFLNRSTQVHFMAEVQDLLDFPPAPNLGLDGKLNPKKLSADSPEMRGQALFFGKAKCAMCHPAPYYTDNSMHNLRVERFYKPQRINGMVATAQGPIKTFTLRGIKESPPYLHDGRLLTLEDVVEFFNLILETQLTQAEKRDLVAFLDQL
ncbi:MAG: cytochrome B6 [Planctomycetes bacterium]|nr:cytochrome B6 [Planctomycetota bacterium]